jgi:hypothetical protein
MLLWSYNTGKRNETHVYAWVAEDMVRPSDKYRLIQFVNHPVFFFVDITNGSYTTG